MTRLWSFCAIVASARVASRKSSESGYSRWTVDRRVQSAHDELGQEVAQLGALRSVRRGVVWTASARPTSSIRMTSA